MFRIPRLLALLLGAGLVLSPVLHAQEAALSTKPAKEAPAKTASTCAQMSDGLPPLDPVTDNKVRLTADRVDLTDEDYSRLLGSVRLRLNDTEISAEELDYDDAEKRVFINARSLFRSKDYVIEAQRSSFDIDDEQGLFEDNAFTLMSRSARGNASRMELRGDKTAALTEVRYTTCAPGNDSWYLEASRITLDQEEGLGTARHARLRFLGVPIFYTPWLQFPIDDRRRTGLLYPIVGDTDKTGFDVRQPVYFNLGPNYDLTLTPRYMSERGTQFNGEGRYLFARSEGELGYQYLNRDERTDEKRDYVYWNHAGLINRRLAMDVRFAEASDPQYFEDLGGNIDLSSISFLERSARFTYQAPAVYSVQALFQDYQSIASSLTASEDPYRRLPQILFNAQTRNSFLYSRVGITGEYDNFIRDNSVEGQRLDLAPFLKIERDTLSWFGGAQFDYHYSAYELDRSGATPAREPERGLPVLSAEYGMRFERLLADGTPQLVEPRVFYLYVPYENQDELPVFDSGEPDFDFTQLFARNRFSGLDRLSDANQLALALTARQLDPNTGAVKAALSVGQLYRFVEPRVALPGEPTPPRGATDFIGAFDYWLSSRWSARTLTQWSPETAEFTRGAVALRYRDDSRRLFEAAYRYRSDLLEQTDLLALTPLYGPVSLSARWRYSIRDQKSLDTFGGLRYETCCWAANLAFRRYISDSQGNFNNGIYLQLELKGLGQIGSGFPNLRGEDDVY